MGDIARHLEVSEPTFYCWNKQNGGKKAESVREWKICQEGNARLKKLVAEHCRDKANLQDVALEKWNGPC